MIWLDYELKSPLSGGKLSFDSPHSLTDGAVRFPIIENIPYLRLGRDELRNAVLNELDTGREREALILLLKDQDDWATTPPPRAENIESLLAAETINLAETISLRDAMRQLNYFAVGDYFAYRWSDPTFLSGLCLLENHLPSETAEVFELACGIGHYLREFHLRGINAVGADVVFSKLWLARKFVAPQSKLVCLDADFDFPLAENAFNAAFCHDAFYFMPRKKHIAAELKRITKDAILIGHAHNRDAENFSSGAAISTAEYVELFETAAIYDDAELTRAVVENRKPSVCGADELRKTEAVSLATNWQVTENRINYSLPPKNKKLRLNPLLIAEDRDILTSPIYPSVRYRDEYAWLSEYLNLEKDSVSKSDQEKAAAGEWSNDERLCNLVRRRIFLDLPENW